MLKIFNTLTRQKKEFKPINTNIVKIYVCGITAYDLCHIGHGRIFIVFDIIVRYLRYLGYQVYYVRNITDIDDKIINKSLQKKEKTCTLANRMIQEMYIDLDALNILRPDHEPKVTDHIDAIIKLIKLLIDKKHAYVSSNGDVMFAVNTACNYGDLSNRTIDKFITQNVTKNIYDSKQNFSDFVLWKSYKPGEPYWISPWGIGRPGWHIECSAMSKETLGTHLDIHGGGSDLIFPHHENEIAQSVCAYDTPYVNVWMHVGMLLLNYKKMSKSSNNFYTIRDMLKQYDAETVRYFLMSTHYRKQLKYNNVALKNARLSLKHLYISLRDTDMTINTPYGGEHFISKFISKMNDDFNIPEAYAVLFDIAHELNYLKSKKDPNTQGIAATLRYLANILGLLYKNPEKFLQNTTLQDGKNHNIQIIKKLIKYREKARAQHKWELADKIRQQLKIMGIVLEDNSEGYTKWYSSN